MLSSNVYSSQFYRRRTSTALVEPQHSLWPEERYMPRSIPLRYLKTGFHQEWDSRGMPRQKVFTVGLGKRRLTTVKCSSQTDDAAVFATLINPSFIPRYYWCDSLGWSGLISIIRPVTAQANLRWEKHYVSNSYIGQRSLPRIKHSSNCFNWSNPVKGTGAQ